MAKTQVLGKVMSETFILVNQTQTIRLTCPAWPPMLFEGHCNFCTSNNMASQSPCFS